jgi:hypothetical protein
VKTLKSSFWRHWPATQISDHNAKVTDTETQRSRPHGSESTDSNLNLELKTRMFA